ILVEGNPTDPSALLEWMSSWPACLILDGLDEVPDAKVRSRLIDAISSFVSELSAQRADVLVVATTRPQGYRGEFGDALPCEQLELLEFTEGEALSYSEALTAVRTSEDPRPRRAGHRAAHHRCSRTSHAETDDDTPAGDDHDRPCRGGR
ncbi:hypothetical protein AB1285_23280, partial [Microbacterium sp. NRRL B-14842]|uniref:hypothetical protein n=1 Tax=Microbacterium sp. NRRL B-14842 TaxID=3162881 RepID=UPI003D28B81E